MSATDEIMALADDRSWLHDSYDEAKCSKCTALGAIEARVAALVAENEAQRKALHEIAYWVEPCYLGAGLKAVDYRWILTELNAKSDYQDDQDDEIEELEQRIATLEAENRALMSAGKELLSPLPSNASNADTFRHWNARDVFYEQPGALATWMAKGVG
jgi:chromosome segregation ATPase